MKNCSFFVLLILILSGCQFKKSPAPIVYNHSKSSLGGSSETIPTLSNDGEVISTSVIGGNHTEIIGPKNDANYVVPAESPVEQNFKIIYHEVQVGETIEEIALKYEQTVEEIAQLNSLFPPYYLDEFQIIKIKIDKDFVKEAVPEKQKKQIIKIEKPDFVKPVNGKVLTKFGESTPYGVNKGINIAAKEGTKVIAAASGKVIYSDYDATFGYLVIIKVDGKNIVTSYAHMEDLITAKGKIIKQGDVIGYVGNTGKVDKFQLHFGIREGKNAKNPMNFVKF
jgi:LysM repeat protein